MVGDDDDEVHHLLDGDEPVLVLVGQPEDLGGHAARGEDPVEGLRVDVRVPADEVGDRLEQLDDVRGVLVRARVVLRPRRVRDRPAVLVAAGRRERERLILRRVRFHILKKRIRMAFIAIF